MATKRTPVRTTSTADATTLTLADTTVVVRREGTVTIVQEGNSRSFKADQFIEASGKLDLSEFLIGGVFKALSDYGF